MVVVGEAATSTSTETTIITGISTAAREEIGGSTTRSIAAGLPMAIERPPTNLEAGPAVSGRLRAIVPVVDWVVAIDLVVEWANVVVWVSAADQVNAAGWANVAVAGEASVPVVVELALPIAPAVGTASAIAAPHRVPVSVPAIIPSVVVGIAEATLVPAAIGEVRAWVAVDSAVAGVAADTAVAVAVAVADSAAEDGVVVAADEVVAADVGDEQTTHEGKVDEIKIGIYVETLFDRICDPSFLLCAADLTRGTGDKANQHCHVAAEPKDL
jgi:hypothetical protein